MKYKVLLIALICPLLSFTCNNGKTQLDMSEVGEDIEKITKIGYSLFGGWIGKGYDLEIMPDSIYYYFDIGWSKESGEYNMSTSPELWLDLMDKLDLDIFDKIESSHSIQMVDGSDREYFIETNKRKISFLNGEADADFIKLKDFFDTVLNLEYECRVRSLEIRE